MDTAKFKSYIVENPNQEKPGFSYRWDRVTADPLLFGDIIDQLHTNIQPYRPDLLVAFNHCASFATAVARGLGVGSASAYELSRSDHEIISFDGIVLSQQRQRLNRPLRIVTIDDAIATGQASTELIKYLRARGDVEIVHAACVIDDPRGGHEAMNELGVSMSSVFTRTSSGEYVPSATLLGSKPGRAPVRNTDPKAAQNKL